MREQFGFIALGVIGLTGPLALAGISDPALVFSASNSAGAGQVTIDLSQGVTLPDGTFIWNLGSNQNIVDTNTNQVLGTITQGSIVVGGTTQSIALSFAVQAANLDTAFDITSALSSFFGISNASARASAGLTLTDTNGNGALLTGTGSGGAAYDAWYNGGIGAGTLFDALNNPGLTVASAFGSTSTSDESAPGSAFTFLGTTVSDIQSRFSFNLSANDSAGGTSIFVVVPAPGSIALLSAGVLVAGRRRR